jgi:uridylate kinase
MVYDSDPARLPQVASTMTHMETINRRLEVMDSTAISLCMDNNLPILVLNLWQPGALLKAVYGEPGTLVARIRSSI